MTMVIVYFCILPQCLWINISFYEDTVENIIHGTICDLAPQLVVYDISKSKEIFVFEVPLHGSGLSSPEDIILGTTIGYVHRFHVVVLEFRRIFPGSFP